jgi:tripartite-type tricarboxylate transporter receptor subunit TctC
VATVQDPEIRKRLEDLGQDLPTQAEMVPAAFAEFQKGEYARWKAILEAAKVKIE